MSLADITKRLRAAENACSRPAFSTNLIAVSKLQPDDRVINVHLLGPLQTNKARQGTVRGKL